MSENSNDNSNCNKKCCCNNELIEKLMLNMNIITNKLNNIEKYNTELLKKITNIEPKSFNISDYIDMVFYINLDKRDDRRNDIERELVSYNLNFERYPAIEISYFGCLGCSYSHYNAVCLAKERGYKNILILEDDFTFVISNREFQKQMENFFKSNIDYDVCLFSYNLHDYMETEYDFLYKVNYAQTTSGYLVNEKYYDTLIQNYKDGLEQLGATWIHWEYAIDVYWKKLQEKDNWFCFKNRIGKQKASFSDISNHYRDFNF